MPINESWAESVLQALNHSEFEKKFARFSKADWEQTVFTKSSFQGCSLAELGKVYLAIRQCSKKFPPLDQRPFKLLPPPAKINAAQSSSHFTAKVKTEISRPYKRIIDLCGGYGIDAYYMHEGRSLIHVEPNEEVHHTAKFNFRKHPHIVCHNSKAEEYWYIHDFQMGDLFYADPSRVDGKQQKVSALSNYLPNVTLLPKLCAEKQIALLLKLSPMLDLDVLKQQWSDFKFDVHLVVVGNELKDLLLHFYPESKADTLVHHIMGDTTNVFILEECLPKAINCESPKYVYDPNPAFKKLRGNAFLAAKFTLQDQNGFLVSDELINDFPGKVFEINKTLDMDKSVKKQLLKKRYSVVSRHSKLNAQTIEKRFKLIPDDKAFILCFENQSKSGLYIATRCY